MGATVEDGGLLMQEVWVTQTKGEDVGVATLGRGMGGGGVRGRGEGGGWTAGTITLGG